MSPALTAPNQPLASTLWRFTWVNALVSLLVWAFEMVSDVSLPSGTSLVIHTLAIAAAMHNFVTHFDTTMSLADRFRFSAAATVISLLTLTLEILAAVAAEGIELTLPGIAEALGMDYLSAGMLAAAVVVAVAVTISITFLAVSFFVWLFRRSQEQGI